MSNGMVPQSLPLPAMSSGAPNPSSLTGSQNFSTHTFDTTGQIAPPGMKPRVTATLWEDEGSLCFQVEAKGVCVARREDNHMINGTKLLNVAGMTRGRRDGILKSEKTRHVVKIGPMHLKGVWIPFERALDFANKEKITEQLYPLFVHDIGALLYHPTNQPRTNVGNATALAAMNRTGRDQQQRYLTGPQSSQAPSLHHHHSLSNPIGAHMTQPPHSIAPHPAAGRPGLDRAHTFPTPPTSASSVMGMGNSGGSYEWGGSSMQSGAPLSIDTGLSNARSVPTTPATTPPGSIQGMQQYQTPQGYDSSRQMYSAPAAQQSQYTAQQQIRYGQPLQPAPYPKTEMAPPSRSGVESEQPPDSKPHEGLLSHGSEHGAHSTGEEEAEHEHDNEYTHTSASYSANRGVYSYNTSHGEHSHLSPEMTGSPSHQNGSGRATPRTTGTAQQWASGYSTPQRGQSSASNLYSVMSDTRGSAPNGNVGADGYSTSGYPSQPYTASNGATPSNKRGRDDDDEPDPYGRPASRDAGENGVEGIKRRKTVTEGSIGGAVGGADPNVLNRTRSTISQRRR
ncbi:hypothetical protein H2201_005065 [Coniosporium apollinis]|uniref:HTH APSES-type domain-containing protein n=1 Tax=Coniosporium apollinis TaxID=61459 RepID=A0ABQ9NQZ5_9PEZI|nr:hypothetical protein H2201_005065 [Coniosporium apollinis]